MRARRTLLTLQILIAVALATAWSEPTQPRPGVLDLRAHSFAEQGVAELNGEWYILWRELIPGDEVADLPIDAIAERADGTFEIPRTWNHWEYRGEAVGGMGYATFIADIILPPDLPHAALWIPNASTAYHLWIDGRRVATSGTPGSNRRASRPHYVMNTAEFRAETGRARLVLQVSNFHHRRGGMWKAIKIGTPEQIRVLDTHETTYDLLLLGSFIALGLFNLFLYIATREQTVRRDKGLAVPLLLAITFFALVLRVLVTGQILTTRLFPWFPWGLQLRIEYLSAMVVLICFAWIADRSYPGVAPRPVVWGITVFVAVNATIALFFPVLVYSRVVTSYNIIKSITLLALTARFVIWVIRGHREGLAMVGAILIFFLITFGETLHYREVILSRDFAPVGFIVALLSNADGNQTLVYLASTLVTMVIMVVVFNIFVLKVSLAFLRTEERHAPFDPTALRSEYGISSREFEILELVATGLSNKEIAARLSISEGTVKNHLYRIMRKLDVGNRTEIAIRLTGLRNPPVEAAGIRN